MLVYNVQKCFFGSWGKAMRISNMTFGINLENITGGEGSINYHAQLHSNAKPSRQHMETAKRAGE